MDGVSGRLVPPEQPTLFAQTLKEVLSDSDLYNRFAMEGKQRVMKSFSIQSRVARFENLYREVLAEGQ